MPRSSANRRLLTLNRSSRYLLWGAFWSVAMILAVFFVRRDALKYVDWSEAVYQRFWPNREFLAIHVAGAGIALLIGPLQFVSAIRNRWPRIHRSIGWVYVVACLTSVPAALLVSLDSSCALCVPPFVVWSATTMAVTGLALLLALLGRHRAHRDFMIRSYALMYAFVFVRLDHHLIGTPLEIPLAEGIQRNAVILWLAWVIPLLACEVALVWLPTLQKAIRARRQRAELST